MSRFAIYEWFGQQLELATPAERQQLARSALGEAAIPVCPFQQGIVPCGKQGGVCSMQKYAEGANGRIGEAVGGPVILCPKRFEQGQLLAYWLSEIAGFEPIHAQIAHEVPFMHSPITDREAGRIDAVVATSENDQLNWVALEIQAVYFSGRKMAEEFEALRDDNEQVLPFPTWARRPDWRSCSAKRLMPQLQTKIPTLRRWGKKLAVAVDTPFFDAIGGPSANPTRDLDDGDIIWMVPTLNDGILERGHWEMLSLEDSSHKLISAQPVPRVRFEEALIAKLRPIQERQREL